MFQMSNRKTRYQQNTPCLLANTPLKNYKKIIFRDLTKKKYYIHLAIILLHCFCETHF